MNTTRLTGHWLLIPIFVVLSWCLCCPAAAADATVRFTARFSPSATRVGETAVLQIEGEVPEGYHLYSLTKIPEGPLSLRIDVDSDALSPVGDWHAPEPQVELDANFNKAVEFFDGTVTHSRAWKLESGEAGNNDVPIVVRGQICNPHQCVPIKESISAALSVEEGAPRKKRLTHASLQGEAFPVDRAAPVLSGDGAPSIESSLGGSEALLAGGLASFLFIAFAAGLGALVTPCVFPMIPITVSYFSKFAAVSLRRSVTMAAIYAGSIVFTFTLLGVLVSLLFGAVGMGVLSSSPGFNLFLFVLLAVFAFNLFGLFEIQIPNWLVSSSMKKEQALTEDDGSLARQALGVFFMAVTFTLVSFTCTVGFIGVVLAEAAKGNWFYPALGMLAFSLAFSLPFFVLAVFPSLADKLKSKRGDWMIAVKVVLGFIELAGAFKFLSNVDLIWKWELVTRPLVLACWGGIFLCAGLYLLRVVNLPSSSETRTVGPLRMGFAIGMLSFSAYCITGIQSSSSMGGWIDGWLPPPNYPGQASSGAQQHEEGHLEWIKDDIPQGIAAAKAANQPLFIDFTGYTCTNCRQMELSVFPRPEVRSKLEQMVRVTAYTDCTEEICEEQRDMQVERYGTAALPFYAVMNPFDDSIIDTFASSTNDPKEYEQWLAGALSKWEATQAKQGAAAGAKDPEEESEKEGQSVHLNLQGQPVELSFPQLQTGQAFELSSLRGEWVFVNFWASWCSPCLRELENDFPGPLSKAPHVKVVTVAFDGEDSKDAALAFAARASVLQSSTNLLGGEDIAEAGIDEHFEVSEDLPASYLIHPDGHIAWARKGSLSSSLLSQVLSQTGK